MRLLLSLLFLVVISEQWYNVTKIEISRGKNIKSVKIYLAYYFSCPMNDTYFVYDVIVSEKSRNLGPISWSLRDRSKGRSQAKMMAHDSWDRVPADAPFENYAIVRHNCTKNGEKSKLVKIPLGHCEHGSLACSYFTERDLMVDDYKPKEFDCNLSAQCNVTFTREWN